jgi:hypothetical protein
MTITRFSRALIVLALALMLTHVPVRGQEGQPISVAAGGLINPRGFVFDESGNLLVAEAGTGGEQPATEPVPPPTGPHSGGPTGRVARITDGCPIPLVEGLSSARSAAGETIGPAALAQMSGRLLLLSAGGGPAHGNPDSAAGVYDITDGAPVLLADLGAWLRANPVANPPVDDLDPDGSWYDMVADPAGGAVWISESNHEQILRVGLDGSIVRVVDLSAEDLVPTALAVGSDGSLYVGHLTSAPFTAGTATVIRVLPDGTTETVWTGLTMITGLAIGPEGELYAAQLSEGRDRPPFFVTGTGRIVRQTGIDSGEEVVTQLNFPTHIEFGPDGALYVSLPAVGGDSGSGEILRVDVSATLPLRGEDFDLAPPACLSSTDAALVKISDLGFDPSTITVQVGATVTWRNTGEFDHAVASEEGSAVQWDSGVMRPGDEFSVTFVQPGTYTYFDGLFPERSATIEVVEVTEDAGDS